MYGLYIGGSAMDLAYKAVDSSLYVCASQRRIVKTISSIELELVTARNSTTTLKFDGKLEPVVGSTAEIGKERFFTLLERRVEERGQETFCSTFLDDNVVNVFEHVHNITLETIVAEFNECMTTTDPDVFGSFDD